MLNNNSSFSSVPYIDYFIQMFSSQIVCDSMAIFINPLPTSQKKKSYKMLGKESFIKNALFVPYIDAIT